MCFRVGVTTTNDASFSVRNAGYQNLPDWPFQILPNNLQKCQKTLKAKQLQKMLPDCQSQFVQIK